VAGNLHTEPSSDCFSGDVAGIPSRSYADETGLQPALGGKIRLRDDI
jgi:hypothetical protein